MNDKKFQKLLDRLSVANEKYFRLLKEAETEFERRFGENPSDVDCDSWIDTYHQPGGTTATVEEVTQWATECGLSLENTEVSNERH